MQSFALSIPRRYLNIKLFVYNKIFLRKSEDTFLYPRSIKACKHFVNYSGCGGFVSVLCGFRYAAALSCYRMFCCLVIAMCI